ncbi:MAG: putative signaling protein [Paucimonas sp.]|nr:putative signaling protein [Paucimonas sp.]
MVGAIDPVPGMDFERLLRLAARTVGMPMAAITVVEGERHTAPYTVGMENPRHTVYLCAYAIKSNDLVIIADTLADARSAGMDVVTGPPHIRFYAGAPLISPTGKRLGTFAVMDTQVRVLTQQQRDDIKTFAHQVMVHLELRNQREELHEHARNLQQAHRLARLGNWKWERHTDQLSWSPELYRLFGRSRAEPIGKPDNFLRHICPDDRERVSTVRRRALESRSTYELTYNIYRPDGESRCVRERGELVLDHDGHVVGMAGYAQDITASTEAEKKQREITALFQSVFEQEAVGITLTRMDGKFIQVNKRFASLLGYTPEELEQVSFQSVTHPDDLVQDLEKLAALEQKKYETYTLEKRFLHRNGSPVWANLTISVHRDAEGRPLHYIAMVEDIVAKKQAESELASQQRLTSEIIDALPLNVYLKDAEGRYLLFNEEAARALDISKGGAIGKTDFDLLPEPIARAIREKDQHVLLTKAQTVEEATLISQGEERVMIAGRKAIQSADGAPRLLGFALDINDRKQSELRAQYLASHDALTGLPNRALLQDRLDQAIARARRSGRLIAIMFLDLDRFKLVNDSFGHKSGDCLLQVMAARLQGAVREGDTVARLGGDEFVILLEDLGRAAEATRVAENVLAALSRPVDLNNHELVVTTSVGITISRKDPVDSNSLLREADIAMYHAKAEGGNRLHYFDAQMNLRIFERLLMENGLRRALECQELVLRYQPFVDLKTGMIVGMEALVRWNHPEKGLLGPHEFMSIAEETGLIIALGEWVLRAACQQQRAWSAKGLPDLRISVNLSAKQFGPKNLVKMIQSVLAETGMDPCFLKLEITETELMQDLARANDCLLEIAAMGIELPSTISAPVIPA